MTPRDQKKCYAVYKKSIEELLVLFPTVFCKDFPLPLGIGVHKQIKAVTGWSRFRVHAVMSIWTSRMEYTLMACSLGKRFDLNGNVASLISEDNMQHFVMKLGMFKKVDRIKKFCKDYLSENKNPALICVPMKQRPDLGSF